MQMCMYIPRYIVVHLKVLVVVLRDQVKKVHTIDTSVQT